jgi:hypothetical protein
MGAAATRGIGLALYAAVTNELEHHLRAHVIPTSSSSLLRIGLYGVVASAG